ncbi:hypothetical protein [Variovorax sp.]|nr:hypothetical protein [Variovorax sp.]HYP85783.1 hypothetical protein [Variovorax sp.]
MTAAIASLRSVAPPPAARRLVGFAIFAGGALLLTAQFWKALA